MKKVIALIICVCLVAFGLHSCKSVSKAMTYKKVDSTGLTTKDVAKQTQKDSSVYNKKDSVNASSASNENSVSIVFDEADTAKHNGIVSIISKGDTTTIDVGDRKIKSIAQKKVQQKKDSTAVKTSATTNVKSADSATKKQLQQTHVQSTNENKNKDVKKTQLGWLWIALIAAVVAGIIYVFKNYAVALKVTPPFVTIKKKAV